MLVTVVSAAGRSTITLNYIFEGVEFRAYHVATPNGSTYEPTDEYQDCDVSWDAENNDEWEQLVTKLVEYTEDEDIAPVATMTTGTDNKLTFSGLSMGMYLIVGDEHLVDNLNYYVPVPFLVVVSNVTDITCDVKYTIYTEINVEKVWKKDSKLIRPEEIEIQLLKDGEVEDTALLSERNEWKYTWTDLDPNSKWTVNEKDVPEGYKLSIRQDGITVTVINAFMGYDDPDEGHEEPPTPPKPDNPPPETPNTSDPFRMDLYMTLAGVSMIALAGLFIAYRKLSKKGV